MRGHPPARHTVAATGAGVVVLALAAASVPVVLAGQVWGPLTYDSMPIVTAALSFAASAFAGVRRRGALRRSWFLLATMILLNTLGAAQWLAQGGSESQRTLSLSDVLYLAAVIPAVVGLILYPVTRGLQRAWRPVIVDSLVVGSSLLLLAAVLVLSEVGTVVQGSRAFMLLVYPTVDVFVISLVVVLQLRSTGKARPDVVLLAASFAAFAGGDLGFALNGARGHQIGALSQLSYVAAGLLLAASGLCAAVLESDRRILERDLSGLVAPMLPDVAAVAALGVCLARGVAGDLQGVLVAAVLGLTTWRRLVLTWQNLRLRHDLEDRVAARTEELRELTAEHQRLDGMKQEFVSAVSHELRTPLTAIRGSLELLADGDAGELPEHALPVVEMAARGSQRLSRLVDDIIDLERLESGAFGIRPEPQALHPLVREALAPLETLARDAGVVLSVTPTDLWASCDGDRVTQAVVNLVGNAIKFTAPGGAVTVSVTAQDEAWVSMSVADTGRGIPAGELEAVFDPFHQVDPDDARRHAGTGLGLAITRRLVEAHGGRIHVESEPGVGSVFHLTLPAACPGPDHAAVRLEGLLPAAGSEDPEYARAG